MKTIIIFFYCLMFIGGGYAQSKRITYILPDSVEMRINRQIASFFRDNSVEDIFFLLKKDTLGFLSLTAIPYKLTDTSDVARWVGISNRYALVGEKYYRLLFDYDFSIGTPTPNDVGEYGHREGNVRRLHLIAHRYTIYFKMDGVISKEEFW